MVQNADSGISNYVIDQICTKTVKNPYQVVWKIVLNWHCAIAYTEIAWCDIPRFRQAVCLHKDETILHNTIFLNPSRHFASINESTRLGTAAARDQDLHYEHTQDSTFQCVQDISLLTPFDNVC